MLSSMALSSDPRDGEAIMAVVNNGAKERSEWKGMEMDMGSRDILVRKGHAISEEVSNSLGCLLTPLDQIDKQS